MIKAPVIPIFIGTSANGEDVEAEMVYEYSLSENTNSKLNITWMRLTKNQSSIWGGWSTSMWPTPFSGFRWAIPEAMGFKGRAIYTDVDMINFRNIKELYDIDLNGKPMAARRGKRFGGHEFCVMVMDCEKMQEHLTPVSRMKNIPEMHVRFIHKFSGNSDLVQDLDPRWNCQDGDDGEKIGEFWQLHYSRMETQPWKPVWFTGKTYDHPRQDLAQLWFQAREKALFDGWYRKIPNEIFGKYDIIGK